MIETLYILVVFAQDAGMNPKPLYEDPRPLTFLECRTRRSQEIMFWDALRGIPVYALCTKQENVL